jgi:hypothetical protein
MRPFSAVSVETSTSSSFSFFKTKEGRLSPTSIGASLAVAGSASSPGAMSSVFVISSASPSSFFATFACQHPGPQRAKKSRKPGDRTLPFDPPSTPSSSDARFFLLGALGFAAGAGGAAATTLAMRPERRGADASSPSVVAAAFRGMV